MLSSLTKLSLLSAIGAFGVSGFAANTQTMRYSVSLQWEAQEFASNNPSVTNAYMSLNLNPARIARSCADFTLASDPQGSGLSTTVTVPPQTLEDYPEAGAVTQTNIISLYNSNFPDGLQEVAADLKFNGKDASGSAIYNPSEDTGYANNAIQLIDGPEYVGPIHDSNSQANGYDSIILRPVVIVSPCN